MIGPPPNHESMRQSVEARRARKRLWHTEGERPLARNLAMVGSLGWLIVVPTLIGVFVGQWLDRTFGTGITWTAALLFVGATGGCIMAWNRIGRE